jgi:hypothetical protein
VRGRKERELEQQLQSVLMKYGEFKDPYFINYLHLTEVSDGPLADQAASGPELPRLALFHRVLTRLGFDELNEHPNLTRKLVMSTDFEFAYSSFAAQARHHVRDTLSESLYSWIRETGTLFRKELPLFVFYLWQNDRFTDVIDFNDCEGGGPFTPLLPEETLSGLRYQCEVIYLDMQVSRFRATLEGFDPREYVNIYAVDSMSGAEFEDFLVKLFTCLGYEIEQTGRSGDQGADLFLKRSDEKIVVQAKNYADNVGNGAVQQALAARSFYGCDEAMVVTNSYFTGSAKELAEGTRVKLIDRDGLARHIDDYNQAKIEQHRYEQSVRRSTMDTEQRSGPSDRSSDVAQDANAGSEH